MSKSSSTGVTANDSSDSSSVSSSTSSKLANARAAAVFPKRETSESRRQQLLTILDDVPKEQTEYGDVELNLDGIDGMDDNELDDLANDTSVFQDDFIQKAKDGVNLREYMKFNEDELVKIEIDSIDDCT